MEAEHQRNNKGTNALVEELGVRKAAGRCRVAAILFTYRCSIQCRHCLFGSAPDRPDLVMTPPQCADGLRLLHQTGRVVHIAGGEPMLYWEALQEALRLAHREGNAPHFIETNCSFASDEATVRQRLEFLAEQGVKGLLASADPFHQEFVPAENFLLVRETATDIFGERNFWGPTGIAHKIRDMENIATDEFRLRRYVRSRPPAMVGTARRELARHLDGFAPFDPDLPKWGWRGAVQREHCRAQFREETMWEIHLDPYGNIQTNCGIILGKVPGTTPAELLTTGPEKANRFVDILSTRGPAGLARLAGDEYGFTAPEKVTQNCELCYLTRSFLRRLHPDIFGPQEVYE